MFLSARPVYPGTVILNDPLLPHEQPQNTPLFRHPHTLRQIVYRDMLHFVKYAIQAIGKEPEGYGCASLRSGGATAASAVEVKQATS